MLDRILAVFRRRPTTVHGTGALPEGQSKKLTFGDPIAGSGRDVVLCRVGGELYALDARCPHEGGRITDGPLVEGKYAVCPLHHYHFDPKTGAAVNAACRKARTYRVREKDGSSDIWV